LKIALVTETFPPEINGVAMTLSHLVEGLSRRGHQLSVLRPRQSREQTQLANGTAVSSHASSPVETPEDLSSAFTEHLFRGFPIPGYPLLRLGLPAARSLKKIWSRQRPDLVHVATEGPLGYSALMAARSLRLPTTSSFHTNFHQYSADYGFSFLSQSALRYLRHFHNRTLATLSPTDELNRQLEHQGFRNMRLLSRGVNTRVFSPQHRSQSLRTALGVKPDDLLVIHVSRLAPEKNYPLLFEAFRAIQTVVPSARLVVVSDGPLRKKLAREHPYAQFTGFLNRTYLAEHYASADLFLYPSLSETFGNVVTEAMASGLPIVAFDYAATARFIRKNENGWPVPLANRAAFIEAAVALAKDAELRQRFSVNARATAETISWEFVIEKLEADFHELTASSSS
jgi:glycosyltransferase involved in cell wall biosynthesis